MARKVKVKQNIQVDGKALADYLERCGFLPDHELADNIEKASKEFRKNFKLRSYGI